MEDAPRAESSLHGTSTHVHKNTSEETNMPDELARVRFHAKTLGGASGNRRRGSEGAADLVSGSVLLLRGQGEVRERQSRGGREGRVEGPNGRRCSV